MHYQPLKVLAFCLIGRQRQAFFWEVINALLP